jgi:hypothetical protein
MRRWSFCLAGVCLVGIVMLSEAQQAPKGKLGGLPGEKFTPPARGERPPERLKEGDAAPDFTLPDPSGKKQVTLSSFKGKRPVVLIFGSCT